jgi:hypothetical protein
MLTQALLLDLAEEIFKNSTQSWFPRSEVYQQGVLAALINRAVGTSIFEKFTYKAGTVEFDAFNAGVDHGQALWAEHTKTAGQVEG